MILDLLGLLQGGTGRQHGLDEHDALIFIGKIGRGHALEEEDQGGDDEEVDNQIAQFSAQDVTDQAQVFIPGPEKAAVEPTEKRAQQWETALSRTVSGPDGFEEGGAQHRRQNQGHHHRQQHGSNDGDGKLAVDDPGGAPEEGHGAEHGGEHQADADQGAGDLSHGLAGGLLRGEALLAHDPLHVFHHHDGVVHQEADGQDHGEHSQHVDGEPEQAQDGKSPEDDHRHRQGGDKRGPEVAQENIHHQEDQENRLEQGPDHLVDGHPHKGSGVKGVDDLHAGWEILGQLRHLLLDAIRGFQGVGPGGLADGQGGGGLAVVEHLAAVALGAQLGAPHVPHPDDGAVRVDAQRDGGELLRGFEQILDDDGGVQPLAGHRGYATELAGGHLHVVGLEPLDDIFHGQAEIVQFLRIEPEPHGVLGREGFHFTHARHPGQHLLDVGLGVIRQVKFIHTAVFGGEAHNDKPVFGGLADLDTGALHGIGEAGHGELELVLHLGPGQVRVGPRREGELDPPGPGGVAGAGHIEQLIEAGHLLLDDLHHAVFHGFGRGAGIKGVNGDGGGGDGGILGDGQIVDGQPPRQHHDDGDNPGKDRAVQKEIG